MACGARLGLKAIEGLLRVKVYLWLNGLRSPFGVETNNLMIVMIVWLNGLRSPFGVESGSGDVHDALKMAKWPAEPVWD